MKKKRILIEDLTLKLSKIGEEQILNCKTIRFEIGDDEFSCTITDDGIEIRKNNFNGGCETHIITINPIGANKILIK